MLKTLRMLWRDEEGPTTVEYAIMLVVVALAVATFGPGIAGSVTDVFQESIEVLTGGG